MASIYVACLASYNNGWLHGKWIDASIGYEEVLEEINKMLKESPVTKEYGEIAEEWAIHDHQGFGNYHVEEWGNLEEICEIANLLESHPEGELILEVLNHLGSGTSVDDAVNFFEDNYGGTYDNLGDFAYAYSSNVSEIPRSLEYYIDWEAMGRDMEINGEIFSIDHDRKLHIFWNL